MKEKAGYSKSWLHGALESSITEPANQLFLDRSSLFETQEMAKQMLPRQNRCCNVSPSKQGFLSGKGVHFGNSP